MDTTTVAPVDFEVLFVLQDDLRLSQADLVIKVYDGDSVSFRTGSEHNALVGAAILPLHQMLAPGFCDEGAQTVTGVTNEKKFFDKTSAKTKSPAANLKD